MFKKISLVLFVSFCFFSHVEAARRNRNVLFYPAREFNRDITKENARIVFFANRHLIQNDFIVFGSDKKGRKTIVDNIMNDPESLQNIHPNLVNKQSLAQLIARYAKRVG